MAIIFVYLKFIIILAKIYIDFLNNLYYINNK